MKALAITERLENQPLTIVDLPTPECGPDQVLIHNHYVGINKGDALRRKRGMFPADTSPPFILGFEGVGEVVAIGSDTSSVAVGDTVGYLIPRGALAEVVAVNESLVFKKPPSADSKIVAASCCIGLTALGLLDSIDKPGEKTMLVHAANGSVGATLLAIGKAAGLNMAATVSTIADKTRVAKPTPDLYALDEEDFAEGILSKTEGRGVDVVFDCLGQVVLAGNMKAIRPHGTLLYYGSASGHAAFPGPDVLMKSLRIQGFVVFELSRDLTRWDRLRQMLVGCLEAEIIKPTVELVQPHELTDAFERIDRREARNRLVLDMTKIGIFRS